MAEKPSELTKLVTIATDLQFAAELRIKAIEQMEPLEAYYYLTRTTAQTRQPVSER